MNVSTQYPTYYPNGQIQTSFTQQPGQTGQAGSYRTFDEQGQLRELQLKSADGHVWLDRKFGNDGSQTNSMAPPGGGGWTTTFGPNQRT